MCEGGSRWQWWTEAKDGAEFTVVWGEPDGGTAKPVVERHVQTRIPTVLNTTSPAVKAAS